MNNQISQANQMHLWLMVEAMTHPVVLEIMADVADAQWDAKVGLSHDSNKWAEAAKSLREQAEAIRKEEPELWPRLYSDFDSNPLPFTPDSLLIRMDLANGTEIVSRRWVFANYEVLHTVMGVEVVAVKAKELARSLYKSCGLLR